MPCNRKCPSAAAVHPAGTVLPSAGGQAAPSGLMSWQSCSAQSPTCTERNMVLLDVCLSRALLLLFDASAQGMNCFPVTHHLKNVAIQNDAKLQCTCFIAGQLLHQAVYGFCPTVANQLQTSRQYTCNFAGQTHAHTAQQGTKTNNISRSSVVLRSAASGQTT